MTRKPNDGDGGLLHWIYGRGEQTLSKVVEEIAGNRELTDAIVKAVRSAVAAKGTIDRNMQRLLNLLNVPSRADYQVLLTKVQTLQGSLINVNMKLDRLLAATAAPKPKPAPRHKASHRSHVPAVEP
jgi:predicted transcriptional regulator